MIKFFHKYTYLFEIILVPTYLPTTNLMQLSSPCSSNNTMYGVIQKNIECIIVNLYIYKDRPRQER